MEEFKCKTKILDPESQIKKKRCFFWDLVLGIWILIKEVLMSKCDEKIKLLEKAIGEIEKTYGRGTIMRLGDGAIDNVSVSSTGSISLDRALGINGIPKGRIIEIYGQESCGKTTLALSCISACQRDGGICAFIDVEHALDIGYAKRLGIKIEDLLLSQPDCGEQALEIVDTLVKSSAVDLVVVDSVAALVPKVELEGEMGDAHVALQARLMSQALRKLTAVTHKYGASVIFINQTRQKIGVIFGNPETTTGGNALKFYASIRCEMRKISSIKDGENQTGIRVRVKVVKNKLAPPFKEAEFDIIYGKGILQAGEILDIAEGLNIIKKSGCWYSYNGEKLGQGREGSITFIENKKEIYEKIKKQIYETPDKFIDKTATVSLPET